MKPSSTGHYRTSRNDPGRRMKRIGHMSKHTEDVQLYHGTQLVACDWNNNFPQSQRLILPRLPSCSETKLSSRLATLLTGFHWDQMWIGLVPVRIGYYHSVDLAALALVEAYDYKKTNNLIARAKSIRCYLEAMASLRETMNSKSFWTSEEAQIAVGILSVYECGEGSSLQERFAHKQGLLTLLGRNTHATDLVRSMAFDDVVDAYLIACAQGVPSPLDSQFWLNMDPTPRQVPTRAAAWLGKLTYCLQIRLPRLMVLVRRLSADPSNLVVMSHAIALASELVTWRAEGAENELLHAVSVIKPQRPEDAYLVPVVLKFGTLAEFKAGIFYWQARIILNRLCSRLQNLSLGWTAFDLAALDVENCRMAKNLLMSWESTFDSGAYGTARGGIGTMSFALAMIAVWGVLTDVDKFHGYSSDRVRDSVLEWSQALQNLGIDEVSAHQMNDLADLFAGGPVKGLLPYLILGKRSETSQYLHE